MREEPRIKHKWNTDEGKASRSMEFGSRAPFRAIVPLPRAIACFLLCNRCSIRVPSVANYYVHSLAFSPHGQRMVPGSWDKTAQVWEATTPAQVARWQAEEQAAADRRPPIR